MSQTTRRFLSLAMLAAGVMCANAETITTNWSAESITMTSAQGELDGNMISVTSTDTSPILGVTSSRFGGSAWDADFALGTDTGGLLVANVNAGDAQTFEFESPLASGRLYIENFDASSSAEITFTGDASSVSLLSGSQSILFSTSGSAGGTLTSSNATSNGEGDAIIEFGGSVTGVSLSYTGGEGANGIFYAFSTEAVPEPNAGMLAMLAATAMLVIRRRR